MEQIHLIDPLAAGEEDRRHLVRLWQECFEADEPYLQVYREQMLAKSGARTVVLREEGKILGMLTLLPCSYRVGERQLSSMYLFAVGTLPEAQGKQVATRMLSWVDRFLPQQGIQAVILAPATVSLYSFYRKRGYEDWFYRSSLTLSAGQTGQKGLVWEEIGAQQFAQQLKCLAGQEAVLWSAQELQFAEAESRLYNGGMYRLWQDGCPVGVCNLYRYTADKVIVKELLIEPQVCAEQLIKQICTSFDRGSIEFRLHPQLDLGQRVPAGMLRFYTQERPLASGQAYLPFILD